MDDVVIYTKENCPFCTRAKLLLDFKKINFSEISLNKNPEKFDEMINYIKCVNEKPVTVKRNYVIKGNLIKSNLNLSLLNRNVDLTDFSVDKNM